VDASFCATDFYATLRAKRRDTLVDVLSGGRTVAEVLYSGPHGVQILPGAELPTALVEVCVKSWGRIVGQLRNLQSPADLIVFDGGSGAPTYTAPLWQVSNYVLLVARTEPISIMDAYATLKAASSRVELPPAGVVLNQAADAGDAHEKSERIASAARGFLNLHMEVLPAIPFAEELAGGTSESRRLHKDSAPRSAFGALAERIVTGVQERGTRRAFEPAA
jgi:flagellar biosynthesis protein FlhG